MSTRCKSAQCDAPIRWVSTPNGKAMPLDEEPNPDGNVQLGYVNGAEVAVVLGAEAQAEAKTAGVTLYMPHWATCPDRGRFR